MEMREFFIKKYFNDGYSYNEIVDFLHQNHDMKISIRHLKRILKKLGMQRRNYVESPVVKICTAVINELNGSGCCFGYKSL